MSDSLWPHGLQHARLHHPSLSPSMLKFRSIELVMLSNHVILCCPLLLSSSIFPSVKVFSKESALCIRWPKYQSFSFNISPSNEYSGLSSFKKGWFDLLAVQGILRSLLPHCNLKASVQIWFMTYNKTLGFVTSKAGSWNIILTLFVGTFVQELWATML